MRCMDLKGLGVKFMKLEGLGMGFPEVKSLGMGFHKGCGPWRGIF